MRRTQRLALVLAVVLIGAGRASAIELSHYSMLPGLPFVDDFFLPPPEAGKFFYAQYNTYYSTDTFRNRNGKKVDRITIEGPAGNPREVALNLDVDSWVIAPLLLWSLDWDVLGARYGGFIMLPIGNPSVEAQLETEIGLGLRARESTVGLGDLFVQPLWLNWSIGRLDVSTAYGFYANTGKYEDGARDNVGLGFWAHQLQGALRLFVDEARTLAVVTCLTGELNENKEGADLVPGSHVTLNWGVRKNFLEDWLQFGIVGYDTWQVTRDSGPDAGSRQGRPKDQVHAAGLQLGVPKLGLQVNYSHEFAADDRFEGQTVSVAFALPLDPAFRWVGRAAGGGDA